MKRAPAPLLLGGPAAAHLQPDDLVVDRLNGRVTSHVADGVASAFDWVAPQW